MSTVVGRLSINLMAKTGQFNQAIGRTEKRMQSFGGTVSRNLGSIAKSGAKAAVIALGVAFAQAVRENERFNQALTRSVSIMGRLSAQMRGDLEATARDVAANTQFSAEQAAESYFFLASAGLDAKQSIAALPQVAKFAQAGMFDMAEATDLLTDAQSALGLSSKNVQENMRGMQRVSDVLVKANTVANASVQQFSIALTNGAGSALRLVNKDIEEGVAVLAAFADQGIKAEEAGTAFGIVMRDLQTKAIDNKQKFAELGVTVFDAGGNMRNLADIVQDLEGLLAGASDEQKKMTLATLGFTDKSVKFIQSLIGMSEKVREYEAALRKAGGTTEEIAEKTATAWQKATAKFTANLGKLSAPITEPVKGLGTSLVNSAGDAMGAYAEVFGVVESRMERIRRMEEEAHEERMRQIKEFSKEQEKTAKTAEEANRAALRNLQIDREVKAMEERFGGDFVGEEAANSLFKDFSDQAQMNQTKSSYSPISALSKGSNEAISAINKARADAKTHEAKMENLAGDNINELKKANDKLDKIEGKLGEGGAVSI